MYEFIQIVTGSISAPSNWDEIYSEYTEISGSVSTNKSLDLAIQITYLTNRINIVQSIVQRLYYRRYDEAIALLVEMGFFFLFEDLRGDLDKVMIKLKGDEMHLNRHISEYKELGESDSGKSTEVEWFGILSAIGKHNGYHINARIITVTEYCALDKEFRLHLEYLKSKQRG